MLARDAMTPVETPCILEDTVARAASLMRDQGLEFLPVVADLESGAFVGVVGARDLLHHCVGEGHDSRSCPVQNHLGGDFRRCAPGDPVEDPMEGMQVECLLALPVVVLDPDLRCPGIVQRQGPAAPQARALSAAPPPRPEP